MPSKKAANVPVTPNEPTSPTPRHAVRLKGHSVAKGIGLVAIALVLMVVTGVGVAYAYFSSLIETTQDVTSIVITATPSETVADPNAAQPVNILVLGTDDRSGANGELGAGDENEVGGMRSDTTMIMHISADRSRIEVVSIPRDSWVKIPACHLDYDADGRMSKATTGKFNGAFATGADAGETHADAGALGAACTMSAIAELTGVNINDFVIVDFAGFEQMVAAVGGVEVDVPMRMEDGYTGLDLQPGVQTLDPEQSLAFVRARHTKGTDGSDISRISNQQLFVSALANKVLSQDVLTSPESLRDFVKAAASSLTVSPGLSGDNLIGLGMSLKSVGPENIQFLTVPIADRGDGANVIWTSAADSLWEQLRADLPVTGTLNAAGEDPSDAVSAEPSGN